MVSLSVVKDDKTVEELFKCADIPQNADSGCVWAKVGDEMIGYCLFDIDSEKMTIRHINPLDDIPLADGILRSTLHVAAERCIMNAFYADTVPEEFFKKIGFIKNADEKTLDIDKLFKSCSSCSK